MGYAYTLVKYVLGGTKMFERILLPLDGSELSKLALPFGEELAPNLFQMAHKIRPYYDGTGTMAYTDYWKFDEDEKKRVSAEMIALETELKEKGLDVTNVVTSGFDAAGEIIDVCKKIGVDLVVMSTHGRSGLDRWVLGNVAEKVPRHGETPLLLVNARAS